MPKVAPFWRKWRSDFGENSDFGKTRQRAGNNGKKRPVPVETGDLAKMAIMAKIARAAGDIQNVANIQIGCQK